MSIFDLFAPSPEKKIASLKKKLQEKYAQPESRQMAMDKLFDMGTKDAILALLSRFKASVEPSITDATEKEYLFDCLVSLGRDKVGEAAQEFFLSSDEAANWSIRLLSELLSEEEVVALCIRALNKIGPEYTRDPQKKLVIIQTLTRRNGEGISEALVPFLEDPTDEVRIETAFALSKHKKAEIAASPLIHALIDSSDRNRVAANIADALIELSATVPEGDRDAVKKALPQGYVLGSDGKLVKAA